MYLIGIYYSNELCMHSTLVHFIGASNSYKNFFFCQKWEIVQFFLSQIKYILMKIFKLQYCSSRSRQNGGTYDAGGAKTGASPQHLQFPLTLLRVALVFKF